MRKLRIDWRGVTGEKEECFSAAASVKEVISWKSYTGNGVLYIPQSCWSKICSFSIKKLPILHGPENFAVVLANDDFRLSMARWRALSSKNMCLLFGWH
jgi:hypothetical protein